MYITEGDLEKLILQDIDSTYSSFISSIIDYVGEYIDQYCGTNYKTDSGSDTRYYDGSGSDELNVDGFSAITSISILDVNGNVETTLATTDWYAYPLNSTQNNKIILSDGGALGSFPDRIRSVKIIGTFGSSSAVPGPIKLAALELAAKVINVGLKGGQTSSESLVSYSVNYRDVDEEAESLGIKEILNQYRIMSL